MSVNKVNLCFDIGPCTAIRTAWVCYRCIAAAIGSMVLQVARQRFERASLRIGVLHHILDKHVHAIGQVRDIVHAFRLLRSMDMRFAYVLKRIM